MVNNLRNELKKSINYRVMEQLITTLVGTYNLIRITNLANIFNDRQ